MTKFRRALVAVTVALSASAATAQTCPGSANSTLINFLGSAGPSNYAVLSLGGPGASVNINLGSIKGDFANVGVPNSGTFKESAPSSVAGNIIVGSLVNTAGA